MYISLKVVLVQFNRSVKIEIIDKIKATLYNKIIERELINMFFMTGKAKEKARFPEDLAFSLLYIQVEVNRIKNKSVRRNIFNMYFSMTLPPFTKIWHCHRQNIP